jgi:acyl-CoA synthetase (AMP-forming)/AMP-acid ligase II/thioesterase domain-containing protein
MLSRPSILELLAEHRELAPDQVPFTFHPAGQPDESVTYSELMGRAVDIAAAINSQAAPSPTVVLLYAPGLEFIRALLGCFYAGAVAVPTYPPLSRRMADRFQVIARDAGASVVLTTRDLYQVVTGLSDKGAGSDSLQVIFTDELPRSSADWTTPNVSESQPAFIQYTSGSTADPKGILVTHGILASNCKANNERMRPETWPAMVSWLPPYHDMGLVGAILHPLASRLPVHLMSPLDFLRDPLSWLRLISATGAGGSGGPNFGYDLCVRRFDEKQLAGVDLSSWSNAFIGADRVRHDTLKRFHATYAHLGFSWKSFYPCYGLAETTLFATGGQFDAPPDVLHIRQDALRSNQVLPGTPDEDGTVAVVSCGQPPSAHSVLIQIPGAGTIADEDVVGEILFAGPSMAASYWRHSRSESLDPDMTAVGGRPYLRTGDLGFIHDGGLYVTGRLKDLIIVRGQNFYPEDIETIAQASDEGLRPGCGAAFAAEGLTSELAILVQEISHPVPDFPSAAVAEKIRRAVAASLGLHLHAIVFIPPRTIPKTSSGKARRSECQRLYNEHGLDVLWSDLVPEPGTVESAEARTGPQGSDTMPVHLEAIRETWRRILGVAQVNDHDDFFDLGGTSIGVARMLSLLETELGLSVPFSALIVSSALRAFAHQVDLVEGGDNLSSVLFNVDGHNRPLHCMLSWPGMFSLYRRLADLLGPQQPVHSILALDDSDGHLPLLGVQDMAQRAATEALRLQPQGGYVLCGYSMGALIAYETARKLTESGKTVTRLILIDPSLAWPRRRLRTVSLAIGMSPREFTDASVRWVRRRMLLRRLDRRVAASEDSVSVRATSHNWDLVNFRAWERYRPGPWEGRVTILRPAAATRGVDVRGWRDILVAPPEVIDVSGDHFTMLDDARLGETARALRGILAEVA